MSYKAIIFDLGKVLIHFDFKRSYQALEPLCPHTAAEIPKRIAPTRLAEKLESGQIEPHDFHRQLCEVLGLSLDYEQFCTIFNSIFMHTLVPEAMLEGLAARYRLILLSNTNAIHFESIRARYPLLRHFHHLVLSHEVKAMKPNPAIYQAVLDCAGCRPEECFYTDDIPEFVEGARKMGIDAVQFQSAEQLAGEMKQRGIVWE